MLHRSRFLAVSVAVALIGIIAGSGTARAGVPWACANTTITNNTACTIPLTLVSAPGAAIFRINLPPAGVAFIATAGVGSWDFVVSNGGNWYKVVTPPVLPSTCTGWSVSCVTLAPGCCCDVCFDQINCKIDIFPSACVGCCLP